MMMLLFPPIGLAASAELAPRSTPLRPKLKCGFHDDLLVEECDLKGFEFCMRRLASGSAPMTQRKGPGLSPGLLDLYKKGLGS